ncbi:MAG: metallophosphoesterase [Clostridia bacterium]|nr:metallophosphoesterase [Clostridia bacterium]
MVYITGDVHGDEKRLSKRALSFMKEGDTLIICGDFGFLWDGSASERRVLKRLGERNYNICFLDGVHENFALFDEYVVSEVFSGRAQRLTGNVIHLLRGEVYEIEGRTYFVMGGGDPDPELSDGRDEKNNPCSPSKQELLRGVNNLEKRSMRVDCILTHSPPSAVKDFLLPQSAGESETSALSSYLAALSTSCEYKKWFFGSLHLDRHISVRQTAVFEDILRADTATAAG